VQAEAALERLECICATRPGSWAASGAASFPLKRLIRNTEQPERRRCGISWIRRNAALLRSKTEG
jgi:hypothetical protein